MSVIYINPYAFYDTDAQVYIAAVEAADGQGLEDGVKNAINAFVLELKSNSIWTDAAQLLLPCGPRTLAGALIPLKGTAPTNSGSFVAGDYSRKLGLTGSGTKYLNSNVQQNSLPASTHALAWYGNITETSGDKVLIGAYNSTTGNERTLLSLDSWAAYVSGRAFRSGSYTATPVHFPVSTSTASATCIIGSKTATNSATLYVDGTATTNTIVVTTAFEARALYWFALNLSGVAGAHSASRLSVGGIYSSGLNSTQAAAFRSVSATYLAALDTAIP